MKTLLMFMARSIHYESTMISRRGYKEHYGGGVALRLWGEE
jgi:hypothetical protein